MPAIVASAPVMKVSRASVGASRPITAAACGPCSASSARSGSGSIGAAAGDRRAQVGDVGVLAAGVDDEEQVVGAPRHHQVVEDAAGVVGEERVALLALGQADDVDRHQRLERGRGVVADQAQLAHVRDVEQRRRLAALAMLGEDAGRVRDRHVVAGERHHLRAELDVQRVQRRLQQRGGVGSGSAIGQLRSTFHARRTLSRPRENCPCCPLYLRDWQRRERRCLPLRWARSRRASLQRGRLRASVCQSLVPERSTARIARSAPSAASRSEALSWRRPV